MNGDNSTGQGPMDQSNIQNSTSSQGTPNPQGQGIPPSQGNPNPQGQGIPSSQTTPPPTEEDTTPANFRLGSLFTEPLNVKMPETELKYDSENFAQLLAGSISLSREEKKRIIDSIPKLRQEQIDELTRIFEEEKLKFSLLSKKHLPQLERLAEQHYREWLDLEAEYLQVEKKGKDEEEAEEIRKQLGL